jgi:hypothetical protein
MLPVVFNTGAIITLWLLFVRLLEMYLPEGAFSNAVHFIYK